MLKWLSGLGVRVLHPEQLAGEGSCYEWTDGVLLCDVVSACEERRGTRRGALTGVDRAPRTGAAKLANVRRALQALRLTPAVPVHRLFSEVGVRSGDAGLLRALLWDVFKAYSAGSER